MAIIHLPRFVCSLHCFAGECPVPSRPGFAGAESQASHGLQVTGSLEPARAAEPRWRIPDRERDARSRGGSLLRRRGAFAWAFPDPVSFPSLDCFPVYCDQRALAGVSIMLNSNSVLISDCSIKSILISTHESSLLFLKSLLGWEP